jgi:hypothetical protein
VSVYDYDYAPGGEGYKEELVDMNSLMKLPCGGIAYYDENSGISYRCGQCMAVVGSVAMPDRCKEEMDKWDRWEALGGKGWDYYTEPEEWE